MRHSKLVLITLVVLLAFSGIVPDRVSAAGTITQLSYTCSAMSATGTTDSPLIDSEMRPLVFFHVYNQTSGLLLKSEAVPAWDGLFNGTITFAQQPAGTVLRLLINDEDLINGGDPILDRTVVCSGSGLPTGALVPGCDALLPIPATAVGGAFTADAPVYWAPAQLTDPQITIPAGRTARVLGRDASGQYVKIIWACELIWVPIDTIGPNGDDVWHGAPLPTEVVE